VPYSNHQVVALVRGSTEPVRVAVVAVASLAASVRTTGCRAVLKVRSRPTVVPEAFVATRR
jgi:hypothetical protein